MSEEKKYGQPAHEVITEMMEDCYMSLVRARLAGFVHKDYFLLNAKLETLFKLMQRSDVVPFQKIGDMTLRLARIAIDDILTPAALTELTVLGGTLGSRTGKEGSVLSEFLAEEGRPRDEQIATFLSEQHGIPLFDLKRHGFDLGLITMIPAEICVKHGVVPIKVDGHTLTIAMTDPGDIMTIQNVQFITGNKAEVVVATESAMAKVLKEHYPPRSHFDLDSEDDE